MSPAYRAVALAIASRNEREARAVAAFYRADFRILTDTGAPLADIEAAAVAHDEAAEEAGAWRRIAASYRKSGGGGR